MTDLVYAVAVIRSIDRIVHAFNGSNLLLSGRSRNATTSSVLADYVDASIMLSRHGRRAPTARLGRQARILIST